MFVVSVILLEFVNSNVPGYVNDYADQLRHRNFYLSLKTSSDWDTNLKENGWRSSCTPTDMIRAGVKEVVHHSTSEYRDSRKNAGVVIVS